MAYILLFIGAYFNSIIKTFRAWNCAVEKGTTGSVGITYGYWYM